VKSGYSPRVNPLELGLPHGEPFIFVDEVTRVEAGTEAEGVKTFPADQDFFRGHFAGNPIVPGVILTEALAQMAGIAAGSDGSGRRFLLSAIRSMKFPGAANPDETLHLWAKKSADLGGLLHFEVKARAGERTVAEGHLILSDWP